MFFSSHTPPTPPQPNPNWRLFNQLIKLGGGGFIYGNEFFCYHVIGAKYPPILSITNLNWETFSGVSLASQPRFFSSTILKLETFLKRSESSSTQNNNVILVIEMSIYTNTHPHTNKILYQYTLKQLSCKLLGDTFIISFGSSSHSILKHFKNLNYIY